MAKTDKKRTSGGKRPTSSRSSSNPRAASSAKSKFRNSDDSESKRPTGRSSRADKPKKSFGKRSESDKPKRSFGTQSRNEKPTRGFGAGRSEKTFGEKPPRISESKPPFKKFDDEERKSRFGNDSGRSRTRPKRDFGGAGKSEKTYKQKPPTSTGRKPPFRSIENEGENKRSEFKKDRNERFGAARKPRYVRPDSGDEDPTPREKKTSKFGNQSENAFGPKPVRISFKKPIAKSTEDPKSEKKPKIYDDELGADAAEFNSIDTANFGKPYKKIYTKKLPVNKANLNKGHDTDKQTQEEKDGSIRLNRYIANSGICSRREADVLIFDGLIKVNGKIVNEMGYKVMPGDSVKYGNKVLNREKMVYLLLNKPKDFLTTTNDPEERKTVMSLVANACKERVYPVGRLDRQTTGLLLFTNDGELTEKLTHPSHNIKKIYQVELDKPITEEHADEILKGLYFEEGKAIVDSMAVLDKSRKLVGIEIHIGWNRIVRRMFEVKGYEIVKLDRVSYAGLDKKDLPRSNWRILTDKEVIMLKHFV